MGWWQDAIFICKHIRCYIGYLLIVIFILFLHQEERTFSDEEEEKLQTALGVAGADLELIIETLEFVLQQVELLVYK